MKKNITSLLLLLATAFCFSQQDAQFTQYMYNTLTVNPAYAGSRDVLGVSLLHRSQWVGLDGAPSTQTFNIQGPYNEKVGLGFSIVHDEIGNNTNQNTSFDLAFSYIIPTSEKYKLSFGLSAGGHLLNVDFNKLRNYSANLAPSVEDELYKKFSPSIGSGVYFYSNKFYVGLSTPNLLETEHFQNPDDDGTVIASERMNIYLISGYVFNLNPSLKFKPAYLMKAVAGAPLQVDLSANFLINEKFTLGAAYRLDAAVSALFGFQMGKKFMLGLAYDREISSLGGQQFNNGSFEIFLRYEFIKNNKIDLTPRFF
ncbi:type IX secretion system membrane protein PorP/SprF [Zobellia amurskyensis]|uniref:Type IX secretion system membrane protein PorP/SprF n=1 Tax=Zobellia amurskyensis TaxID=248905 RepID=A0A7X2ZUK6_9FLAO|nr:type IX secretion system membrane protein PorP/SprF [Zobellia amurskyensis]MUH36662.1 type IX secretion system membrane protein PorP/SprF [Zobellia amurskyensis]